MLKDINILVRVRPKDLPTPTEISLLDKIVEEDILVEVKHTLRLFGFDIVSTYTSIKDGPKE